MRIWGAASPIEYEPPSSSSSKGSFNGSITWIPAIFFALADAMPNFLQGMFWLEQHCDPVRNVGNIFEDSEPGGFKDFLPAILFQFRPVMTLRNKGSLASSQGFVAAAPASRTFEPLVRESVAGTCHPLFCTSEIRVKQNIQKHIDTCLQQKTTLHANMKFVSEQTLRRKTDRSGTSSQVG